MFPTSVLNNDVVMSDNKIIKASNINEFIKSKNYVVRSSDGLYQYTNDGNSESSKIRISQPHVYSLPNSLNSLNQVMLDDGSVLSVAFIMKIYNQVTGHKTEQYKTYNSMGSDMYNTVLARKPVNENYKKRMNMAGPGENYQYQALNVNNMVPFHTANGDKYFRVGSAYSAT